MLKALSTSILLVLPSATALLPHEQEQVGCVADMRGNFFDLNPLSKVLDSVDPTKSKVYEVAI